MQYLLDTNICIYINKRNPPAVLRHFERVALTDLAISIVTYMELVFGAKKSQQQARSLAVVERLRSNIVVLPLDVEVANHFAEIKAVLERKGTPMGPFDLLIAAHARSLDLTLVTNNTREFSRVPGLRVENWAV